MWPEVSTQTELRLPSQEETQNSLRLHWPVRVWWACRLSWQCIPGSRCRSGRGHPGWNKQFAINSSWELKWLSCVPPSSIELLRLSLQDETQSVSSTLLWRELIFCHDSSHLRHRSLKKKLSPYTTAGNILFTWNACAHLAFFCCFSDIHTTLIGTHDWESDNKL